MWKNRKNSHANRGMFLEEAIRQSNARYKSLGIGIVEKIPTEWKPLRGAGGQIISAKVENDNKGVPDFMGAFFPVIPVAFDVKETSTGRRFPLEKISEEQVEWLTRAHLQSWVVFTIHYFAEVDRAYLLPFGYLRPKYMVWKAVGGRKAPASIPLEEFEKNAYQIKPGKGIVLDYKAALDIHLQA